LLNSVLALHPERSWQLGYNVNIRLQRSLLTGADTRAKVAAMFRSFFEGGGQELQVNAVDPAVLRAACDHPERHGDLVVRVAGFSEFFTKLSTDIQQDIIAREEHEL
jgi:formate C-acetyltransferase